MKVIIPVAAGLGSIVSYLFGGWDTLLMVLIIAVVIDYFTGLIAGAIEGKLSSSVGIRGIGRKVLIFSLVTVAHLIDTILGSQHFIREATIIFYLCNELLSIIENVSRVGVPVPTFLIKAVDALKSKRKK